jgi:hypothetical protein
MVNSATRGWPPRGPSLDADTRELLTGYANGYNRYLRDTGVARLPADCRNQAWVQPITGQDVLKVLRKLLVRASTGNFVQPLVAAAATGGRGGRAGRGRGPPAMLARGGATSHPRDPRRDRSRGTARLQRRALRQQRRGLGSDLTGGAARCSATRTSRGSASSASTRCT